jgi:hypothetical protein
MVAIEINANRKIFFIFTNIPNDYRASAHIQDALFTAMLK